MSTNLTPVLPTSISKDITWLKSHLAFLAVVAALVAGSVYGVDSLIAKHDAAREAKDTQILNLVTSQTNDLKARMTSDEAAATARDLQYNQIISELSSTITKQNQQLQQQVKVNSTLTSQQTARAISDKTKAQAGQVTTSGGNVVLDLPEARTINSSLDMLATAQAQIVETQKQLSAQIALTVDANMTVANGKKVIDSQTQQIAAASKVCTDEISVIKAQARKSKFKFFVAGVVVGLVGGHWL
jgi:flagellar biosynthesis chaperone FliJ